MKPLCIIQSRLSSTRLPHKALADLCGKPMIVRVVERVMQVQGIEIVVAVPSEDAEAYIEILKPNEKLNCYLLHGDSVNVWSRFKTSINYFDQIEDSVDIIVRITGDCCLILPDVIATMLDDFAALTHAEMWAFMDNDTTTTKFPDGLDVEIFTKKAFLECLPESHQEREHVTLAMKRKMAKMDYLHGHSLYDWPNIKLSVDTQEDLDRARKIYQYCGGNPPVQEDVLCKVVQDMQNSSLI